MKIIQSFWTGGQRSNNPMQLLGGWIAPEYHWMSLALSSHLIRRYYDNLELITDEAGYYILIEKLKLPYTSVQVVLNTLDNYPVIFWGLAKIYAQSIQNEPFLHIDNDVYIFEKFSERLLAGELIAQNLEYKFPIYKNAILQLKDFGGYTPAYIPLDLENYCAYNAGIIGGKNLSFYKKYLTEAISFVRNNEKFATKFDSRNINMLMEQGIFNYLSMQENIPVECYFGNDPITDCNYPGLSDFDKVPFKQTYIHALGLYKGNYSVLLNLAKRLRHEFPHIYYDILKICRKENGPLLYPIYEIPNLSIEKYDASHFLTLKGKYQSNDLTKSSSLDNWSYYYAKQMNIIEQIDSLSNLSIEQILKQIFVFDSDAMITELYKPVISQTLHFINVQTLNMIHVTLDNLNMILLDAFQKPITIIQAIEEIILYYKSEDVNKNYDSFQNIVIARMRELFSWGVLRWVQ